MALFVLVASARREMFALDLTTRPTMQGPISRCIVPRTGRRSALHIFPDDEALESFFTSHAGRKPRRRDTLMEDYRAYLIGPDGPIVSRIGPPL